jgi:endo-1,3(4)-beta-glucanase
MTNRIRTSPSTVRRRRLGAAAIAVAVPLGLAACGTSDAAAPARPGHSGSTSVPGAGPADAARPAVDTQALTAGVEQRQVAKLGPSRLAPGVLPPTNRWYSGLAFGDAPQPVFAEPLSFALTADGFTIGLPKPVASDKTIAGPHVPAITVVVDGVTSSRVSKADPVGVTVDLLDASGAVVARVSLAEGAPWVGLTAARDVTVHSTAPGGAFRPQADGATATVDGRTWGVAGPAGDPAAPKLAAGQSAGWYAVPDHASSGAAKALAAAAAHPVTGVGVTYGVDDTVARTTLSYGTTGPGAYVLMPHQRAGAQPHRKGCGLGTYPSVYGDLELCAGRTLTAYAPTVAPTGTFDLGGVPQDRLDAIRSAVRADVAATPAFPSDTYFGGKALYRAATLVTLGEQVGAGKDVADLRRRTEKTLTEWTQKEGCAQRGARCVVYDSGAHSAIGLTASFGSDQLNDHHFHYGYLLSAAGLLAKGHPDLVSRWKPVMDLLGQDVAAARPSKQLPQLRMVDPYSGHSWASGTAPFADGNNQESSSEAVNAWNGLGLWAGASDQPALRAEATWLASNEADAARTYWTDTRLPQGFGHQVVALDWGGKRDWATWFSGDPNAILGIQLIPMGPVQAYLAGDPGRIRSQLHEAAPGGTDVQFGGYLEAYRALAGSKDAGQAWDAAQKLPATAIDDGSSRAATFAFIASAAARS